jgi:hypothetical protein
MLRFERRTYFGFVSKLALVWCGIKSDGTPRLRAASLGMSNTNRNPEVIETPLRSFPAGASVEVGSLEKVVVVRSFHEGKVYEVEFDEISRGETTGKRLRRSFPWHSLYAVGNKSELHCPPRIRLRELNSSVDGALSYLIDRDLPFNMDPPYQRELVWDDEDRCRLLDSVFSERPIGRIVIRLLGYAKDQGFEIIDGKQRLSTLRDFFIGRREHRGLFFHQLGRNDRIAFERAGVVIAIAENITDADAVRLFLDVNDTGRGVSPEHLRKVRQMQP